MSGEKRLSEFLSAIETWKACKNLVEIEENENVDQILNMNSDDIKTMTGEECLSQAYELYAYGEYIESVKVKEKIVLDWADSSIWYIISTTMQNYGTQYTKWQEKYYSAIKENPLATDILKVKNHAEARVSLLSGKSDRIQKMAEILNNLARRKQ